MRTRQTPLATIVTLAALAVFASACIVRSSGPNENREESFGFTPVPAQRQEAVEAFREMFPSGLTRLDEATITPIGKIETSAGPIVFADFQVIDPELGRQQCSGSAGPTGGGWGCGPLGQEPPDDLSVPDVTLSSEGSSGSWSDLQLVVSDDVAYLEAVAEDGTRYRMEPINGVAWMEWKTEHGDLSVTAFNRGEQPLGTVQTGG